MGRQFADNMTTAKAARIRSDRIENRIISRKKILEQSKNNKKWTISTLWKEHKNLREKNTALNTDICRYEKYLKNRFANKSPEQIEAVEIDKFKNTDLHDLAPQTVKHILNLLTWIVNYGMKRNLCKPLLFHMSKSRSITLKLKI